MIVTSVASSSQSGVPAKPSVTAALNPNATQMASEMSVIMPGSRAPSLPPRALQEWPAADKEDCGAEDGRNQVAARHMGWRISQERREHVPPHERWNREQERQPEFAPEQINAVTCVLAVPVMLGARDSSFRLV